MYNETYDDYIRNILGYSPANSYSSYQDYRNQDINYNYANTDNIEIEKCYPEIYKIIYPMITTKCSNVRGNIKREDIENMTDEIYYALEERNDIKLNINLTNEVRTTEQSNVSKTVNKKPEVEIKHTIGEKRETRQINRGLRDLIKILLIRELLNRPGRPPMRPPMRPPYRPGPGRIPFNRDFEFSDDMFEMY